MARTRPGRGGGGSNSGGGTNGWGMGAVAAGGVLAGLALPSFFGDGSNPLAGITGPIGALGSAVTLLPYLLLGGGALYAYSVLKPTK